VGLREFQDEKADVILKYNVEEARNLRAYGEIPADTRVNEADYEGDDEEIMFTVEDDVITCY
jgi:translation initiation factor 1A